MVVGFNAKASKDVKAAAKSMGVDIRTYNIIYQARCCLEDRMVAPYLGHSHRPFHASTVVARGQLLDDVRAMMSEALPRVVTTTVTGSAEVLARFEIGVGSNQTMSIAGCRIKDGSILRNGTFRLFRNGRQIHEGVLDVFARPRRGSYA